MKTMSRRKLITTGLAATAGASGLAAAANAPIPEPSYGIFRM